MATDWLVVWYNPNDSKGLKEGTVISADTPDQAEDKWEPESPELKISHIMPFLHSQCLYSRGICGSLTAGQGELDGNGYWQFMCPTCAQTMEEKLALTNED